MAEDAVSLFQLEGPDQHGNAWIVATESGVIWRKNLGPCEEAAGVMAEWLGQLDCQI